MSAAPVRAPAPALERCPTCQYALVRGRCPMCQGRVVGTRRETALEPKAVLPPIQPLGRLDGRHGRR